MRSVPKSDVPEMVRPRSEPQVGSRSDLRRSKIASQSLLRAKLSSVAKNLRMPDLSTIPGEGDIHAPILRLSLGRVVWSNRVRFAEALSR